MKMKIIRALAGRAARAYRRVLIRVRVGMRCRNSQIDYRRFDFPSLERQVLAFVRTLELAADEPRYRYSQSCERETLYASAYACMTRSMLDDLENLTPAARANWVAYFDSFQSEGDGLFYDPVVRNEIYDDSDWWGARHLALHMIAAYTALGARPKYQFNFLKAYYSKAAVASWLDAYDWTSPEIGRADIDNKIMNVGCLLQYQRDAWGDEAAGVAVDHLKDDLRGKINPKTGLWGGLDPRNARSRSRMVQFAYHLLPLFFYDEDFRFDLDRIVRITLDTQNRFGGFSVVANSSACEDIDSIDLLVRLQSRVSEDLRLELRAALERAFSWVMANQVQDGGFVFRLEEAFRYGSDQTQSLKNQGALFPTWFRVLSILYLRKYFDPLYRPNLDRAPGYAFL